MGSQLNKTQVVLVLILLKVQCMSLNDHDVPYQVPKVSDLDHNIWGGNTPCNAFGFLTHASPEQSLMHKSKSVTFKKSTGLFTATTITAYKIILQFFARLLHLLISIKINGTSHVIGISYNTEKACFSKKHSLPIMQQSLSYWQHR
jgi:hypothetical protein